MLWGVGVGLVWLLLPARCHGDPWSRDECWVFGWFVIRYFVVAMVIIVGIMVNFSFSIVGAVAMATCGPNRLPQQRDRIPFMSLYILLGD